MVATQGELPVEVPEAPPTGVLPTDPSEDAPAPVPLPGPDRPNPVPPPQHGPAPPPALAEPPPGTLLGTTKTPQPAAKPAFDPAAYDLTATLFEMFDSGSSGQAGAKRTSANVWQVTVIGEGLVSNTEYSIIVTRPEPSWGTPGPTPCYFTATRQGWGTCTGELWVTEGGRPENISLMSRAQGGNAAASGGFG